MVYFGYFSFSIIYLELKRQIRLYASLFHWKRYPFSDQKGSKIGISGKLMAIFLREWLPPPQAFPGLLKGITNELIRSDTPPPLISSHATRADKFYLNSTRTSTMKKAIIYKCFSISAGCWKNLESSYEIIIFHYYVRSLMQTITWSSLRYCCCHWN